MAEQLPNALRTWTEARTCRSPSLKAIQAYSLCAQCSAGPRPSSALPRIFSYCHFAFAVSPRWEPYWQGSALIAARSQREAHR